MAQLIQSIPATFVASGSLALVDQDNTEELELTLAENADVLYFGVVGVGQPRKHVHFKLMAGSRLRCYTVACGSGDDQLTVDFRIEHVGRAATAYALVKGVFGGSARAEVDGLIDIPSSGQQAESFLEQRALMLSAAARANLQPQLQIEANEVKASHAAAIGHVDGNQLFYCQTRGLARGPATGLIVGAFLVDILRHLPDIALRQAVAQALRAKLDLPELFAAPS